MLFIVANVQAEYLEPVIDTRVYQAQRMRLTRSPEQCAGRYASEHACCASYWRYHVKRFALAQLSELSSLVINLHELAGRSPAARKAAAIGAATKQQGKRPSMFGWILPKRFAAKAPITGAKSPLTSAVNSSSSKPGSRLAAVFNTGNGGSSSGSSSGGSNGGGYSAVATSNDSSVPGPPSPASSTLSPAGLARPGNSTTTCSSTWQSLHFTVHQASTVAIPCHRMIALSSEC
eukprot:5105-Heterococcus_DN1.PRE.6